MIAIEKKIKNRILILILMILLTTGIVIISYENYLIKNHIEHDISTKNKNINKTFNLFIDELDKDIAERTNFMLSYNTRLALKNRDRKALYKNAKEHFKRMRNNNKYLKIMTFRLPDGSAFLRVHKPKMFGDSLDKKRKIILDTILSQKRQFGFEVGKLKMTHRIVTPIFYDNKLIGVVEIGVEPEYIIEKINNIFNIESSLFVKNEQLEFTLHKIEDNYKYKVNDFIFVRGSKLIKDNLQKIDFDKKISKIEYKGKNYYIDTIKLFDHKGKTAAKMLISYDLTAFKKEFDEMLEKNLMITFLVIIILFVVLNMGLNYFLKKIDSLYLNILKKDKMMLHQSKLASMGEMIGNIAHQWRQPLSVISTSASGIRVQNELGVLNDETLHNSVNGIVNSTKYLSQTIDDFMDFVKNDKSAVEFDIKENIEKNIEILKGSLKIHQINLVLNCHKEYIKGFPNELTQVFINIVHNAKDALKEQNVKEKYIFIETNKTDKDVEIIIKDNANGIPNHIINKVFDPYFTTKNESNGTGLGLYMSYRIITESMKGNIKVENVEYNFNEKTYIGAMFTISLPFSCQN
ncbi:ATP-binding protein [Halarcobacter sp.]|uniref:ATP-binding protein n=1 Tax=Halarcobacter sp. TaxID=2321133 RepID=UPI002AA821A6|nr:ATP-binding protein [Halarcobacter sp.]